MLSTEPPPGTPPRGSDRQEVLMWTIAAVFMGAMVLASLVGVRSGPPFHVLAVAVGILTAAWFVLMIAGGKGAPVLWALLGADLVVSAGLAVATVGRLRHPASAGTPVQHLSSIENVEGVAVSDLSSE